MSQRALAECYAIGRGVLPVKEMAAIWQEKAAAGRNPHAQHYLAHAYFSGGFGVPKNPKGCTVVPRGG